MTITADNPHGRRRSRSEPGFGFATAVVGVLCVLAAIAGYLGGGFLRFAEEVTAYSSMPVPRESDGIVVLTGGAFRIDRAIDLLSHGKAQRLLISGVNPGTSAPTLARITGGDRQLFECCIDLDYGALDTVGNARNASRWAQENGFRRLILVTSDYHMPRALREFDRTDTAFELVPYTVRRDDIWLPGDVPTVYGLRVLLTEYTKLVGARFAGLVGLDVSATTAPPRGPAAIARLGE